MWTSLFHVGYAVVVLDLNSLDNSSQGAKIIWTACLVGAAVTVVVDMGLRPKFGSPEQRIAYKRALRTSELPADIELDVWRRWLDRSRLANLALWLAWPFGAFGVASSASSPSAYRWVPVSAFALLTVWGFAASWWRLVQISRLAAEVNRRRKAKRRRGLLTRGTVGRDEERWKNYLEGPLVWRVLTTAVVGFALAFLVLLVADLESLIYSDSRNVHLECAAFWAAPMGLAGAVLEWGSPRLRGSFDSVEQLIAYYRALRIGQLPARIEPDMWRSWLKSSRRTLGIHLFSACFLVAVGVSSILTYQSVYRWVTASLFELLAIRYLVIWWGSRVRLTRLAADVERCVIRQTWG